MIHVVDNTLRDGSYVVDFNFSETQTSTVCQGLDDLGFSWIEVGHGLGLGAWNKKEFGLAKVNDKDLISAAKKSSPIAKIGAFFIPGIGTIKDIKKAKECGLDFLRIGININSYQETYDYLAYAKKAGLFVAINLMKSYAVKSYEFCEIIKKIDEWGLADVIYLVDSAGCMMPNEIDEYIDRVKQKTTTSIGFHGHNNLSMALANTLQAINSGATYVDSCIRGMGRSAGNTQTEILIYALQKTGIDLGINLYDLYDFAERIIDPIMPRKQGLNSNEIHIGVSRFHSSYMPLANKVSSEMNIDKRELIRLVSDINCLNPTESLFNTIGQKLAFEK